jgi:hypothetical protein
MTNDKICLTIPGALEWDGDNGTHGVVGTHSADGESCSHGDAEALAIKLRQLRQVQAKHSKERDDLCTQLANTEQSRRSFFDLSQDLEKKLGKVTAFVQSLCDAAGSQPSVATGYLRDILDALSVSAEPATDHSVDTTEMAKVAEPKPYAAMSEAEADAFLSSFGGGSGNKAKRRIAAIEKAKQKTCIECDQPYCHGVCVERGDQDYDRDQAEKGGDDE